MKGVHAGSDTNKRPSNLIDQLVGPAYETPVKINGNSSMALLDSGSQVSTVSEEFFKNQLGGVELKPLNDLLRVEVAGGSRLLYLGYIEVDLELPGKLCSPGEKSISALLLVVPTTSYNSKTPVLLGTNVIYSCKALVSNDRKVPGVWSDVFKICQLQLQMKSEGIPVYSKVAVEIPAQGEILVDVEAQLTSVVTGGKSICLEADGNMVLPSGLFTTPMWIDNGNIKPNFQVEIKNISDKNVKIPACTEVCRAYQVKQISSQSQSQQISSDSLDSQSFLDLFKLDHLDSDVQKRMSELLLNWKHVFSVSDVDLGLVKGFTHSIELLDETPFKCRRTHIPHHMVEEVREHLRDMEKSGVIQPSHSQYASPLVLVRKSDNSLRFCVDFRNLNKRTKPEFNSVPSVDSTLDRLVGAKYFTSLDLKTGYWQLGLNPADCHKTAFTAGSLGFWEYLRMPMGLSGACSSFQRMMESVMGSLNLEACLLYLDDVIIFSDTIESHFEKLSRVFQRISEFGLKLKPSKCEFFKEKLKYLGFVVSEKGIEADPEKINSVVNWPVPTNFVQLRRFLGFAGYFRRFIRSFAQIAKPLHSLLKGSLLPKGKINRKVKFEWLDVHEVAFRKLVDCLTSTPVLAFADFTKPFELETDASSTGLGAILFQRIGGSRRVIAFASRGLNAAESKYPAHKLECLALKWAICDKFRDYLYGAPSFLVLSDNNPLTYLLTTAKLDAMTHRWVAELSQFNFSISYRSGKSNVAADALSRKGDHVQLSEETVKAIIDLKDVDDLVSSISLSHTLPELPSLDDLFDLPSGPVSVEDWSALQREDPHISSVIDHLQRGVDVLSDDGEESQLLWKERRKLSLQDNVLFRKRHYGGVDQFQLVLPVSKRRMVFEMAHDKMGHLCRDRVIELIRDRFYWPRMQSNIERWLKMCDRCLRRNKSGMNSDRAPLHPIVSHQPMEIVCMDYLGLETSVGGYNSILVLTDHFTRFAMAVPTRNQTALTTAKALVDLFVQHYGLPLRLHSDMGPCFESKVIKELCQLLGIERSHTTPYHPMGNGQCERMNRTLIGMLGTLPAEKKSRWKDFVLPMVHAYNCTKHASTGFSPFELMFGRKPRLPLDLVLGINRQQESTSYAEYISKLENRLKDAYVKASKNVTGSINKMLGRYNSHMRGKKLEKGDRVLVKRLRFGEGKHKLEDFWEEDVHVVISCHPDVPVYDVKKESGRGRSRKLHRNLLLPIAGESPNLNMEDESEEEIQDVQDLYTEGFDFAGDSQGIAEPSSSGAEVRQTEATGENIEVQTEERQEDRQRNRRESLQTEEERDSDEEPEVLRRSSRRTKKPAWMTSGEYVTDFQQSVGATQKEKMDLVNSLLAFLK